MGCSVGNARASRAYGLVVTSTVIVGRGDGRGIGIIPGKVSKAECWRSSTVLLIGQLVVAIVSILERVDVSLAEIWRKEEHTQSGYFQALAPARAMAPMKIEARISIEYLSS
jgi:hypothetical protein